MSEYVVIIETSGNNLSAYVPDLPGCVATGKTDSEILTNMREAMRMHIAGMHADGEPIPEPTAKAAHVLV